jgi:DNA repair exonuclease SbcCD ATPase subunit
MSEIYSKESLINLKKTDIVLIAKKIGIKNIQTKKKDDIINIILNYDDKSEKYSPFIVNEEKYEKIFHISDIHIRPLKRHIEYQEVFENLYSFLENKTGKNIIAITGDIIHEKDNLKPETILLCRSFIKKLSEYGTVIIITGNHDMLENNTRRLDTLTAIFDDLDNNVHYLVKSGAYQFGNIIFSVSSLVDKKFIKRNQLINTNSTPVASLYHGTISGCVNDFGYVIEEKNQNNQNNQSSSRFRKISDFDGYDMVLLGDIHKHQYLKPHIAYPGSLIQQNFGENLKEHGVLIWDIISTKSTFVPIKNRYGFININVINNNWKIPDNMPEKPYIRLLLKNTNNEYSEIIKSNLDKQFILQSFSTKQLTETLESCDILPDEVTLHQDDIDILIEEMDLQKFDDKKKENILDIHNSLKSKCFDENLEYSMNNQNWKMLKISFKNVFIFGENKTNVIDFTNLNGITSIIGPNAIGKSNIINIIIFLLYGSNINFKVPHILNKHQNEYFIECEIMFGAKKYKITKSGKKRKGNKLNHSLSFYIYEDEWVQQDQEHNKATSQIIKSLLGTVEQFLLTNVYSNSSLRTLLTLTNSEKHKALSNLFCLDIYENLEKLAKKDVLEIKKQCSFLEGEKRGIMYHFKENDIKKIKEDVVTLEKILKQKKESNENSKDKITFIKNEINKINFNKKELSFNLKHFKEEDYDIVREKLSLYERKYPNLHLTENYDSQTLKSDYYRLEGSIIKVKDNSTLSNLNVSNDEKDITEYEKTKLSLIEKIKKYDNQIIYLQKIKQETQNNINQLYKNIIDIPEIEPVDNSKEIKRLCTENDFNSIDIQKSENELIILKSKLINFKINNEIDNKLVILPANYDNNINTVKIDKLLSNISYNNHNIDNYKKQLLSLNQNVLINKKETTLTENINTRVENCDIIILELKTKIKNKHILPNIEEFSINETNIIQSINENIDYLQNNNNIISEKELSIYINYIENLPDIKIIEVKKDIINNIKSLLIDIKNNIKNTDIISVNNKLINLLNYKDAYSKNKIIDEFNLNINLEINNILCLCYSGNIDILCNNNKLLNEDIKKFILFRYIYQYSLYTTSLKLQKNIKYTYLVKCQEKFVIFLKQKEKNNLLINNCKNLEFKLEQINTELQDYKKNIIKETRILNDIINLLNNACIYNNNCIILEKMKYLKNKIENQEIKNTYIKLKNILEKEKEYIEIKLNNLTIQKKIVNYDKMIDKLTNEQVLTSELYFTLKNNISSIEKDISLFEIRIKELGNIQEKANNINHQLKEFKKDLDVYSDYINLVNKNTIPTKLINKKNLYIQDHINTFLENLTSFSINITSDNKSGINFCVNKKGLELDVNQLSGYETFILNIALKSALNKYSFISKSTLFILDEGLDVVDKDNFKKLDVLMKLLMRHYKHILLISHMPKVKDLQNHEINIQNNGISSYIST